MGNQQQSNMQQSTRKKKKENNSFSKLDQLDNMSKTQDLSNQLQDSRMLEEEKDAEIQSPLKPNFQGKKYKDEGKQKGQTSDLAKGGIFIEEKEEIKKENQSNILSGLFGMNKGISNKTPIFSLNQAIYKKIGGIILNLKDVVSPLLKQVLSKNLDGIKKELDNVENYLQARQQQYEVTVAFWLALHLEYDDVSNYLLKRQPFLKKLVGACLHKQNQQKKQQENQKQIMQDENAHDINYMDIIFQKKQDYKMGEADQNFAGLGFTNRNKSVFLDEEDLQDESVREELLKTPVTVDRENKINNSLTLSKNTQQIPIRELHDFILPTDFYLSTEEATNQFKSFESKQQISAIKIILTDQFPELMSKILKVVITKKEEKLCDVIITLYKFNLTIDVFKKAIENEQLEFLKRVFQFGKNWLFDKIHKTKSLITFKTLISQVHEVKTDPFKFKSIMKQICEWKLDFKEDNFLEALVEYEQDELALQYLGDYHSSLNESLVITCILTHNTNFMKQALLNKAFEKIIFREENVVNLLVNQLNNGSQINYILDVLILIDISVWKNKQLKEILDIFHNLAEQNYEINKLLFTSNPIMTIALACEILHTIQNCRKKFENECKRISQQLLRLGQMYLSKISNERYYERIILDTDMKGRSVLKIIAQNSFEKLMDEDDPKAENLMNKIWKGKESANCDGSMKGYSSLQNVVFSPFIKLSSNGIKDQFSDLAKNGFEPVYKVNYSFQFRFRSRSISFYFLKEFLCALLMLVIFQSINYQYLSVFKNNDPVLSNSTDTLTNQTATILVNSTLVTNQTTDLTLSNTTNGTLRLLYRYLNGTNSTNSTQEEHLIANEKNKLFTLSFFFAVALLFQWFLKLLFNFLSKYRIPIDKWTFLDLISAISNILALYIMSNVTKASAEDPFIKDTLDYFMIFVLAISWIRFFIYFLVIRNLSKLLLTLVEMVEDTISFIFIVTCFLIIMSSIFTTLYQDVNPEKFGSLSVTVRTLFDACLAVYTYDDMGGRLLSYSILIIFHVFCANILLLNYLIAILSTTYENMKQSGVFKYKKNLFQYCERFVVAFEDHTYGELVLHPPPLSYLCFGLLPFILNNESMKRMTKRFSFLMFWIENFVIIFMHIIYELVLVLLAYLKTLINIMRASNYRLHYKIGISLAWLFVGIPYNFTLMYRDLRCLFALMKMYEGGKSIQAERSGIQKDQQVILLNQARDSVIHLYMALKKHFEGESEEDLKEIKRKSKGDKSNFDKENLNSEIKDMSHLSSVNLDDEDDDDDESSFDLSQESESDCEAFDIGEELQFLEENVGYDPTDQNCMYVVKMTVLLEDWKVRRKMQIKKQEKADQENIQPNNNNSLKVDSMYSRTVSKVSQANSKLASVKSRISMISKKVKDENDTDDDGNTLKVKLKKAFDNNIKNKLKFDNRKSKVVMLDKLLSFGKEGTSKRQNSFNKVKTNNFMKQDADSENEIDDFDLNEKEVKFVERFFGNFVLASESSLEEHLDIVLFLRAVPERITLENIDKIKLYNFRACQESLIAYQNLDLVNAFEYFDDKNRERVQTVKEKLQRQRDNLAEVSEIVKFIKRKMYNSGSGGGKKADKYNRKISNIKMGAPSVFQKKISSVQMQQTQQNTTGTPQEKGNNQFNWKQGTLRPPDLEENKQQKLPFQFQPKNSLKPSQTKPL